MAQRGKRISPGTLVLILAIEAAVGAGGACHSSSQASRDGGLAGSGGNEGEGGVASLDAAPDQAPLGQGEDAGGGGAAGSAAGKDGGHAMDRAGGGDGNLGGDGASAGASGAAGASDAGAGGQGGSGGAVAGGSGGAGGGQGSPDAGATCGAGFVQCVRYPESSCHQSTFTFESGTTEGFAIDALDSGPGTTISASTARAHGGSHSLAVPINSPNTTQWAVANVTWCSQIGEVIPLGAATLSMWIYLDGPAPLKYPDTTEAQMMAFTESGRIASRPIYNLPLGVWHQVTYQVDVADPGKYKFENAVKGLTINFGFPGGWGGTVYVDDISVTPPM
jgi:hypothetical protein